MAGALEGGEPTRGPLASAPAVGGGLGNSERGRRGGKP